MAARSPFTRGIIAGNRTARAGGGIENNGGTVNLVDMTLGGSASGDGNFAGINGGGLHIGGLGTTTTTRMLVANNRADNEGGGLWNGPTSTLNVNNTTVSGNSAATGGGVFNKGAGTLNIANTTIAGNRASGAGGGLRNEAGIVKMGNTLLALNTAGGTGPDGNGVIASQGYNLIGQGTGSPASSAE